MRVHWKQPPNYVLYNTEIVYFILNVSKEIKFYLIEEVHKRKYLEEQRAIK